MKQGSKACILGFSYLKKKKGSKDPKPVSCFFCLLGLLHLWGCLNVCVCVCVCLCVCVCACVRVVCVQAYLEVGTGSSGVAGSVSFVASGISQRKTLDHKGDDWRTDREQKERY